MAENNYNNVKRNRKEIFFNNFIGGLAWGIGVTIGLTIFLALLAFIGTKINTVPIVGNYVSEVINYLLTNGVQQSVLR